MNAAIKRVRIENYRSIRSVDIELSSGLTFLVGPNGSGKSNFLDALRFVAEIQRDRLDEALRRRGGPFCWYADPQGNLAESFSIYVDLDLGGTPAYYIVQIGRLPHGGASILWERGGIGAASFIRPEPSRSAMEDPMLRSLAAVNPTLAPLYAAVSGFTFYAPEPTRMRAPYPAGSGTLLMADASNAADVLCRLGTEAPEDFDRVQEYWRALTENPGGAIAVAQSEVPYRYLLFKRSANSTIWFNHDQASEGTLRFLAILLACFQARTATPPVTLLGIEEPENNLHPGATALLFDALSESPVQVLVSTHSADLLSVKGLAPESVLVFSMQDGATTIGQLTEATRDVVKRKLYTVGELLRANALDAS